MRKLIQLLLNKYGSHLNSEINTLVTQWYNQSYQLFDLQVSLRDVEEQSLLNELEQAITGWDLSFEGLGKICVIPSLDGNNTTISAKVVALPALFYQKLSGIGSFDSGFWFEADQVILRGEDHHISVVHDEQIKSPVAGLFINGTLSTQEVFSFHFNQTELEELFRFVNEDMFHGVAIQQLSLLNSVVESKIFYRMLDSDIGFLIEQEWPELYRQLKTMVWSNEPMQTSAQESAVFASWGGKIGIVYQAFDIKDRKEKELQSARPVLNVVVDNTAKTVNSHENTVQHEEVCQEWGKF